MSPKPDDLRSNDPGRNTDSLMKTSVSDNGSSISLQIPTLSRFGTRSRKGLADGDRADIEARFWPKVNKAAENGCWLWTASVAGPAKHGQFTFRVNGRQHHVYAHRISYELVHGPILDGLNVCHHCDTPRCVNPAHLFLGTQRDNIQDAGRKGRLTVPRERKLTLAERLDIFHAPRDRRTGGYLARKYGVSHVAIFMIRRGRFVGAPHLPQSPLDAVFERVPSVDLPVVEDVR